MTESEGYHAPHVRSLRGAVVPRVSPGTSFLSDHGTVARQVPHQLSGAHRLLPNACRLARPLGARSFGWRDPGFAPCHRRSAPSPAGDIHCVHDYHYYGPGAGTPAFSTSDDHLLSVRLQRLGEALSRSSSAAAFRRDGDGDLA